MMKGMAAARLRRAVKNLKRGSVLKAGQQRGRLSAEERFEEVSLLRYRERKQSIVVWGVEIEAQKLQVFRADSSGAFKLNDLRYSR
jgi:hypothetical protein